ncbi:methyltransferase family protein [Paraburkholderia kururiensis]|uniref:methyltransferase family protein n=1 Tax=Paraburkholderia kururiensis TaxID=984307 RepID=UPI001F3F319A|nr:isoprenylcysteine carboxylmethyltransferase family protein [Paraburkholderia kururiensis]
MKTTTSMPLPTVAEAGQGGAPEAPATGLDRLNPEHAGEAIASTAADLKPSLTPGRFATEIAVRLGAVLMFSMFVSSALHQFYRDPTRLTLMLLVVSEAITLALAVCTRVPRERDWHPLTVVISTCASFYFVAFQLAPGSRVLPETVAAGLQIAGMALQISAKLTLRRSYGILPANRGVVVRGPYRVLRHPIYVGYFITNVGFLAANFGVRNLFILVSLWALQGYRVLREEKMLLKDPAYRDYARRVRYRVMPGLF